MDTMVVVESFYRDNYEDTPEYVVVSKTTDRGNIYFLSDKDIQEVGRILNCDLARLFTIGLLLLIAVSLLLIAMAATSYHINQEAKKIQWVLRWIANGDEDDIELALPTNAKRRRTQGPAETPLLHPEEKKISC